MLIKEYQRLLMKRWRSKVLAECWSLRSYKSAKSRKLLLDKQRCLD